MAGANLPLPPINDVRRLTPAHWGMIAFLLSEVAFFATLIVAYLAFLDDNTPPKRGDVLSLPLAVCTTVLLLASSAALHRAETSLRHRGRFGLWWTLAILLGIAFLAGTAYEWHGLIVEHGLTISRNLFGTTYYTLVGFHALHVTAGIVTLTIVLFLVRRFGPDESRTSAVELAGWYWHFVDCVWIVVFLLVYVIGR